MAKKLLLAEDSLTIRKVFELALSRSDIAITAVDNGEDAVRLAGEISPDLVVADLTLPGKNGFAVSAELRAMEKTEKIPVLILSGTLVPLDEARFKASGAKGVLFKPFESRELVESIERLLREEAAVPDAGKPQAAGDERWDFSDVLDEVEAEAAGPAIPTGPVREELLPGAILPVGARPTPPYNEFDVTIDEIEGESRKVEHLDSDHPADSPPAVTDLSPALDDVEEIEEIEHLEDVEVPMPPADAVSTETPASLRILPVPTAEAAAPGEPPVPRQPDAEPVPPEPVAPEPVAAPPSVADLAAAEPSAPEAIMEPPSPPIPAPSDASRPGDKELRELFAGRAEEIFRTVALEAVEKVMWEMTDRLAAELSAKIRESVDAVAWEVIPSTAETLIREEIARIREMAGKPSP